MAYDHSCFYYKHMSPFTVKFICMYSSTAEFPALEKITEVHMACAGCTNHNEGINQLLRLMGNPLVEVDKYDGFKIIRVGKPKNIWLPDSKSVEFMKKDLARNNGTMAYWDYASIAIITSDDIVADLFEKFLRQAPSVTYTYQHGITIK